MYNEESLLKALDAFERGQMVVVTDDDSRENEGDLIVGANHCTTEKMAFMIRHTSGIICVPISSSLACRLELPPMVAENSSAYSTAFTVSVDSKADTTTGISAFERNLTVHKLADISAQANDFVRPGHVFPLIAREGGVLTRAGHTEAAVDLCLLTKQPPIAVIGELMNDDGTVQHGAEVSAFAFKHKLPMLNVEDLIMYRRRHEVLVKRIGLVKHIGLAAELYEYMVTGVRDSYGVLVVGDASAGKAAFAMKEVAEADLSTINWHWLVAEMNENIKHHTCMVYIVKLASKDNAPIEELEELDRSVEERNCNWASYGASAQILQDLAIKTVSILDFCNSAERIKYHEEFNVYNISVEG